MDRTSIIVQRTHNFFKTKFFETSLNHLDIKNDTNIFIFENLVYNVKSLNLIFGNSFRVHLVQGFVNLVLFLLGAG